MELIIKELNDANTKLSREASDIRSQIDSLLCSQKAKDDELVSVQSQHAEEVEDLF